MKSKEKTKALIKKLSEGIQEIKSSEEFKAILDCMANFHSYSWRNTLLIHMQYPEATRVAGYRKWQKMDRQVKKGQKGISILAPFTYKNKETDKETGKEDEQPVTYFYPVTVFDINQTEGEELPELKWKSIDNTHAETLQTLLTLAKESKIEVEFQDLANCDGVSKGGKIAVQKDKNPTEKALILIHELAHEFIHRDPETRPKLTTEQKEMEAEATAYIVAQALGVPQTNSEQYLALYHKSYDLEESLEAIHETSQKILKAALKSEENGN